MSVNFKDPLQSSVLNAAFGSKTADNTYTGQQTLNRFGSGDTVSDVQLGINASQWKTQLTESISASGEVSSSTVQQFQYRRVQGDAAPVSASSTPFGSTGGWLDGTTIRLVGVDDTNTVTISNNDASKGCLLNGEAVLKRGYVLELQYDSVLDRFIEINRNWA